MKVYIVEGIYHYDSTETLGVYDTHEKATIRVNKSIDLKTENGFDDIIIKEFEVE